MKMTSGDTAALPAAFPKDVYLPEHYAVKSAMEMPNAMVLEIEAPGAVAALAADAGKRMQAQGWKQQMAMAQTGQSQVLVYEKEKRSATLSFTYSCTGAAVGFLWVSLKQPKDGVTPDWNLASEGSALTASIDFSSRANSNKAVA